MSARQARVVAPPGRKNLAWLGGSNLSQLERLEDTLVWQDEWEERGAAMLHPDSDD